MEKKLNNTLKNLNFLYLLFYFILFLFLFIKIIFICTDEIGCLTAMNDNLCKLELREILIR